MSIPPKVPPERTAHIWSRFISNSSWGLLASVASRASTVLTTILIARILGKIALGELGILISTVGMFTIMASFGLNLASAKYVSEFRKANPKKVGAIVGLTLITVLTLGLAVTLGMIYLGDHISSTLLKASHLKYLLYIMSSMVIFQALCGVQMGILTGMESFRLASRLNLLLGLLYAISAIVGACYWGLPGVALGLTIHAAVSFILQHIMIVRILRENGIEICFRNCFAEIYTIWHFCTPAFLSSIAIIPVTWICNVILVNQPQGYAEMGAFSIALQWFSVMLILPGILGQAVFPIMNERAGAKDYCALINVWKSSLRIVTALACALCICGVIASRFILSLYGPDFPKYVGMLQLMFAAGALHAILDSVAQIIMTRNRMWALCTMNIGFAGVCLTASFYMASWGALGLASARVAAYMIHSFWIILAAVVSSRYPPSRDSYYVAI